MDDTQLDQKLSERFKSLPKIVQDAITSASVEQHLRALAETHKLHIDQWALLENEVMLTLLGFQKTEDLAGNIAKEVGIDAEAARALADDISKVVFEPIRGELDRRLDAPTQNPLPGEPIAETPHEAAPTAPSAPIAPSAPQLAATPVVPATPPSPAPEKKVERAPVSQNYAASMPSHERTAIEGDPYREQIA
ncbi:MAG: hypothetical protein JO019_04080 [Candidatus Kaiserbacteria bacterium]|nr:hypothetical protein [Candidatus Kaiserbacteria bacterium]